MADPVVLTPLGPISAAASRYVEQALSTLGPDDVAASVLAVHTEGGRPKLEAVFAFQHDHGWSVAAWVVTDFKEDLAAGAYVRKVWKRAATTSQSLGSHGSGVRDVGGFVSGRED